MHLLMIAVLGLFAGVGLWAGAGDAARKDLDAFKGVWTVVSAERDGKKMTAEQLEGIHVKLDTTGKVAVQKGDKTLFEGTIKLDPSKKPKAIDTTQTSEGEFKGKTTQGIYELSGNTLKVCSAEPGKDRPKTFSAEAGSGQFYRVYERAKK
jgi:uncharacterized protein (TIGR03067 family)